MLRVDRALKVVPIPISCSNCRGCLVDSGRVKTTLALSLQILDSLITRGFLRFLVPHRLHEWAVRVLR